MKCKNCGAELNNGRCAYCGSTFAEDMRLYTLKEPEIDEDLLKRILLGTPIVTEDREVLEVTCIGDSKRHFIYGV